MLALHLPEYAHTLKKIKGELYIFEVIRRKYLLLTPEEWVRQQFIQHILLEYDYPKSLIRTEIGLQYDRRQKRSDILIFDRAGLPFWLIECKAQAIALDGAVFRQAIQYNAVLKAPYLGMTNGIQYTGFVWDEERNSLQENSAIPSFPTQ
jgi:hypothetical protein